MTPKPVVGHHVALVFLKVFKEKKMTALLDGFIWAQISRPFSYASLDHYKDHFYDFGQVDPLY